MPCGAISWYAARLPVLSHGRRCADQSSTGTWVSMMPASVWDASIHWPSPVRSRWYSAARMDRAME